MGLFNRLKDLTLSNINALIDKAEDPEKMLDQYLRDMQEDILDAEKAVSKSVALEMKFANSLSDEKALVTKREGQALKALEAGNEELARKALEDKAEHQAKVDEYEQQHTIAKTNADKLRHQLREMKSDYEHLNNKKEILKARAQAAKAQKQINDAMSGFGHDNAVKGFDRMSDKVTQLEAEAQASEELMGTNQSLDDELAVLDKPNVDDELAALKERLAQKKG